MTTISAKTILRSRNATDLSGNVLSCLLLRYPRPIHSEFMTHKMLVKNSASSRAIPVRKLIQSIKDDPFVPLFWGKNQKGMQAGEEHNQVVEVASYDHSGNTKTITSMTREEAWLDGMEEMLKRAAAFDEAGYHKQIVNRLIEPWMHITVLATGMEHIGWSNFLGLRDHEMAEPHIQFLAKEVRKCLERDDDIQTLRPGEWHLPFVNVCDDDGIPSKVTDGSALENAIKLSTARCASTSYKTVEGFDMDLETATRIHDQLIGSVPMHASPAEHVAQADAYTQGHEGPYGEWRVGRWDMPHQHRAFSGFRQYRAMLSGEHL